MPNERILLLLSDEKFGQLIERSALTPAGYQVTLSTLWETAKTIIQESMPDLLIISDKLEDCDCSEVVQELHRIYPFLPVILTPNQHTESLAIEAVRQGYSDYLVPPVKPDQVQQAVRRALEQHKRQQDWIQLQAKRDTQSLRKRVNGLEAIQRIGRSVTSLLDLDSVLTAVVGAAVDLTHAEEGSLLLLDENTGELYIRAGKNFQEDFVSTFRLPIRDTLAGQVLRTGKPLFVNQDKPQKIKTAYLVHTIVYVPLIVHDRVIGVLEVDNRQSRNTFSDYHVTLVSALADYAAIAIENARLYSHSEVERNKLETIVTKIDEGVIVIDQDKRIVLINRVARESFGIIDDNLTGKRAGDVVHHQDLIDILRNKNYTSPSRMELNLPDGRVLNAQITPIPEIGLVVNMQDITHLKELDRIKSDFVKTVSHDLRSPLTAILGYVELIDRVGPVTDQQRDFIRRVQLSVDNITSLIDNLLDLGRIEAGFDARKEIVPFSAIIQYAVDGLESRYKEKSQTLIQNIPDKLPKVLGNPTRLRQMLNNIIANAINFTPKNGEINITASAERRQVILQIADNGPGIPPADQPYIFDKFYRASNVPSDVPGTGLGLAIVKSIVDNHMGRIWVESMPEDGATFTIVLPAIEENF